MTIRVEIEGRGVVAEFPDGTPQNVIDAAVKRDFFSGTAPAPAQAAPTGPIARPIRPHAAAMIDVAEGAGKRIIGTAVNATALLRRPGYAAMQAVTGAGPDPVRELAESPDFKAGVEPANAAEKGGKIAVDVASFAAGDKGASKVLRGAGLLAQGLRGAAVGGAVTKLQGGSNEEAGTNAVIGGFAPAIIKGVGEVSKVIGRKILSTIIRPSIADVRDGFVIGTVEKYDLGGSMDVMAAKTHEAITSRAAALQADLQAANAAGAEVDVLQVLTDAQADALGNRAKTFGKNKKVAEAFDELVDDLNQLAPNGRVDLLTAQQLKRATGNLGAWKYGARDPESNAMEIAANALYSRLKTAIEASAPNAKVAAINKEIGELIPVENAIIKRIPVEQRNNVLSLGDVVMIANGQVAGFALNKALKMGGVGASAIKAGKAIGASARPVTAAAQAAVVNE